VSTSSATTCGHGGGGAGGEAGRISRHDVETLAKTLDSGALVYDAGQQLPQKRSSMNPQFGRFGGKAGLALVAVGLAVIGIAYNAVASQTSLLAQLPYLVSGGLIGISLVIVGSAVLVVNSAREDRALLEAKLDALTDALLAGAGTRTAAGSASPSDLSGLVVAGTASFHVPGCRLVDGREETSLLTPEEATSTGLKPCRVCQPQKTGTNVTVR